MSNIHLVGKYLSDGFHSFICRFHVPYRRSRRVSPLAIFAIVQIWKMAQVSVRLAAAAARSLSRQAPQVTICFLIYLMRCIRSKFIVLLETIRINSRHMSIFNVPFDCVTNETLALQLYSAVRAAYLRYPSWFMPSPVAFPIPKACM